MDDDLSFGEWISFHMDRGTRPSGRPDLEGSRWATKELAGVLGVDSRTVRNWRGGRTIPPNLDAIEKAFFGKNDEYESWLSLLRKSYRLSRSGQPDSDQEDNFFDEPSDFYDYSGIVHKFIDENTSPSRRTARLPSENFFLIERLKEFYQISHVKILPTTNGRMLSVYRKSVSIDGSFRLSDGIVMHIRNTIYLILNIESGDGLEFVALKEPVSFDTSMYRGYIIGQNNDHLNYIAKCILVRESFLHSEIQKACIISHQQLDSVHKFADPGFDWVRH